MHNSMQEDQRRRGMRRGSARRPERTSRDSLEPDRLVHVGRPRGRRPIVLRTTAQVLVADARCAPRRGAVSSRRSPWAQTLRPGRKPGRGGATSAPRRDLIGSMNTTSTPVTVPVTAPTPTASPARGSSTAERELTTADRCDACGAQAFVRVVLASGELLFCGHHGHRNMAALERQALFIQDETSRLTAND